MSLEIIPKSANIVGQSRLLESSWDSFGPILSNNDSKWALHWIILEIIASRFVFDFLSSLNFVKSSFLFIVLSSFNEEK